MYKSILTALLISTAAPLIAQNTNTNTSGSTSGSTANSGSLSGASSDNQNSNTQGQAQTMNGNIGTSESTSTSNAGAVSGSSSVSGSNSDQTQGQGQDQGQSQGQSQMQGQAVDQGNAQNVGITFNNEAQDKVTVRTNTPVGLAASSSFSSDYCGGTMSGGASAAPIGISIGMAGPRYDKSCQALRRAEKFGMAAANAQNMGQPQLAQQLMSMMIWSICTSDTDGSDVKHATAQACSAAGLLGSAPVAANEAPEPPTAARAVEPKIADASGKVTPEAVARAQQAMRQQIRPDDPRQVVAAAQQVPAPH